MPGGLLGGLGPAGEPWLDIELAYEVQDTIVFVRPNRRRIYRLRVVCAGRKALNLTLKGTVSKFHSGLPAYSGTQIIYKCLH